MIQQQIAVVATLGAEARMEFGVDRLRPQHRHAVGQKAVHAAHPGAVGAVRSGIKMHNLQGGVYARVRAPCRHDFNRMPGNHRQRTLQRILHTTRGGLRLPATKTAAIVFDPERDSYHSDSTPKPTTRIIKPYSMRGTCNTVNLISPDSTSGAGSPSRSTARCSLKLAGRVSASAVSA